MPNADLNKSMHLAKIAALEQLVDEYEKSVYEQAEKLQDKEEALRRERDLSREYLAISGVMILVLNADQTVRLINRKGCEILGYQEEEIVGKRWVDHFLPKRDRARLNSLFDELKTGKPLEHVENPVLTKDGRERMISWHNTVLRDAGGAITGTLSSGEDITERNQAELRLAAQHAVTQVLAESLTLEEAGAKILRLLCECFDWEVGGIWKVDRDANLLRCLEIWHDQNVDADEFVAASRQRTFAPGIGMPGRVWSGGKPAWIPDVLKDSNFPRAPMAAKAGLHGAVGFPIKVGKNVYGIFEFFSREIREPDVTLLQMTGDIGIKIGQFIERNRAEMALQESNTRFKQLAENVDEIFYITDADITKILYANPAYETIWGRTCQSLYDDPLSFIDAIHPDDRERAFAFLDQQKKGLDTENEYRIVRPDGSIRWVRDRGYPVRNERGQLHRIVGIVQDITQRKQMEAHAGELERLTTQGQLMDGIAHEMKNPLFMLTGRLQLMKEKLAHQEYGALSDDLQKIESAATRMVSIADRFSKLVKAPSSSTEPTAVQAVLQQVLELLAGELTKNRIAVTTALAPDLPVIQANPRQLQMAFTNLIVNAMQAMASAHGKGTLTVTAAIQNGWIEVRIQDDGPGIAPEHRARLFEPFFTTKPAGRGTGMSLWAVRSTVMALRGTVACETDTGKGATFIMRLPAATPDGQP